VEQKRWQQQAPPDPPAPAAAVPRFDAGGFRNLLKTDDDALFRDSLGYFPAAGFEITWQTFDLHKNEPDWNLRTEHEGMFSEQGIPIKALIARKGPDSSVTWVEPKELARRLEPEEEADPAGEVQE